MSNSASRAVFASLHAGFRNGKMAVFFLIFGTIGLIAGPDYVNSTVEQAVIDQQEDCAPVVWQDAWMGTPRADAWDALIDEGWKLDAGTHADVIRPPGCEASDTGTRD